MRVEVEESKNVTFGELNIGKAFMIGTRTYIKARKTNDGLYNCVIVNNSDLAEVPIITKMENVTPVAPVAIEITCDL